MILNSLRRSRKILFLDRDDTIIKDHGYLNDPNKVEILDGLVSALKIFRDNGFEFIVTTNQSGLTRGIVQIENLDLIHNKIQNELNKNGLRVLGFYSAPYGHDHKRRKPNGGLTLEAMNDYQVDIRNSFFAGDKWRDLEIGFKLGARTILVNEAKDQRVLFKDFIPNLCLKNWKQFSQKMMGQILNNEFLNLSSVAFVEQKDLGKNLVTKNLTSKKTESYKNN